jgi:hypothetical protein
LLAANGCAAAIRPGKTCQFTVKFAPRGLGRRSGELTFDANIAAGQISLPLAGEGFVPTPPVDPTPVPTAVAATPTPTPTPVPTPAPTPEPPPSTRVAIPFRSSFAPPPGVSRAQGCRGQVTLRLQVGSKVIATRKTRLNRRCRYATTFRIARSAARGRTMLKVVAQFGGNRYLAPTRASYRVRVPA